MVWVRERTIPTERPPLVGEVIANFCGYRVPRGQRDGSLRPYSRFSRQEPLLFYQVAPQVKTCTSWIYVQFKNMCYNALESNMRTCNSCCHVQSKNTCFVSCIQPQETCFVKLHSVWTTCAMRFAKLCPVSQHFSFSLLRKVVGSIPDEVIGFFFSIN
jgi:hypothetical protein